jgi:Bifunctional DNA primase/polymerase, N-terminal
LARVASGCPHRSYGGFRAPGRNPSSSDATPPSQRQDSSFGGSAMSAAETALAAALALGLPAFPCRPDKAPACPHGFRDAVADRAGLRELWHLYPGSLVGVPTGESSGFDALDIDAPRHSEAANWFAARRDALPETRTHRTRSGGLHVLFRHAGGLRSWAARPVPGVDGRAAGGYVVWWPGAGEPVLRDVPPAAWPGWLLAELAPAPALTPPSSGFEHCEHFEHATRYAVAALRCATKRVARAEIGSRNRALNCEAYGLGRLIADGLLDGQDVADALAAAAIAAGLAPREIEATLRSAFGARGLL